MAYYKIHIVGSIKLLETETLFAELCPKSSLLTTVPFLKDKINIKINAENTRNFWEVIKLTLSIQKATT